MSTIDILGFPVSNDGLESAADVAERAIAANSPPSVVACANPHSLVVAASDPTFTQALSNANILLPDGTGIVLAARLLKLPIGDRVAGMDLFTEMTKRAQAKGGVRYFFLGASQNTLDLIVDRINREFPNVIVCGTYSPPFKEEFSDADNAKMVEAVNAAEPDVLWVGMTAPKQEKWIQQNRQRLNAHVIAAIGAVFDYYAGTRKRAPDWVCKIGLEWLPRLIREPRRVWRRNFISTPIFLAKVLKQKMGFQRS